MGAVASLWRQYLSSKRSKMMVNVMAVWCQVADDLPSHLLDLDNGHQVLEIA